MGFSGEEVGLILASLKITYGLGQLVNGQLSERVSPRLLLTFGMFGSAALNIVFGLGTGFYFLLFVWAMNGYGQSLGWTPCVRVVGNWIPPERRGKAIGLIGTGYQLTAGLTYVVAGQAADYLGWRGALYVPSVILVVGGVVMLLGLRESPDGHGSSRYADRAEGSSELAGVGPLRPKTSLWENIVLTLSNRALWLLGISLGLLNACRYGFLDWGLAHLTEVQESGVGTAGLKYVVLPVGGVGYGSLLREPPGAGDLHPVGWARCTDDCLRVRRANECDCHGLVVGCDRVLYLRSASPARRNSAG